MKAIYGTKICENDDQYLCCVSKSANFVFAHIFVNWFSYFWQTYAVRNLQQGDINLSNCFILSYLITTLVMLIATLVHTGCGQEAQLLLR